MPLDGDPIFAFPRPSGWSEPERVEDSVDADGLVLHRVGLASSSGSDQAVGSAADWRVSPVARGSFELLERIALLEAARAEHARFPVRTITGEVVGEASRDDVFPPSPEPAVPQ